MLTMYWTGWTDRGTWDTANLRFPYLAIVHTLPVMVSGPLRAAQKRLAFAVLMATLGVGLGSEELCPDIISIIGKLVSSGN